MSRVAAFSVVDGTVDRSVAPTRRHDEVVTPLALLVPGEQVRVVDVQVAAQSVGSVRRQLAVARRHRQPHCEPFAQVRVHTEGSSPGVVFVTGEVARLRQAVIRPRGLYPGVPQRQFAVVIVPFGKSHGRHPVAQQGLLVTVVRLLGPQKARYRAAGGGGHLVAGRGGIARLDVVHDGGEEQVEIAAALLQSGVPNEAGPGLGRFGSGVLIQRIDFVEDGGCQELAAVVADGEVGRRVEQ